jgi:trehalose utilization protein
MGTPCSLQWREAGEKERVWVINPNHPISRGLGPSFVVPQTEMYGEPFSIPEPLETIFISWPIYHDPNVQTVLRNAVRWAYNPAAAWTGIHDAPNARIENAPEPIKEKGPKLHAPGEAGYR